MIDISFAAASALVTRALINELITRYPAVRPLVLVLKYFLIQVRVTAAEAAERGS
jgi:DNA polymerase sigma